MCTRSDSTCTPCWPSHASSSVARLSHLLDGKAASPVPILIGFNHDEMWALLSSLPSWIKGLEVEAALAILFDVKTASRAWNYYKDLYPTNLAIVSKILTDYIFTCSSQALALALPQPAYVYQYNHLDSFGPALFSKFGLKQCAHKVCHEAELPFVFGNRGPPSLNVTFTPAEVAISQRFQTSFTDFAHGRGAGWAPFSEASNRTALLINTTADAKPLDAAGDVCKQIWDLAGYVH